MAELAGGELCLPQRPHSQVGAARRRRSRSVGMMYRLLKDRHMPKKAKLLIHMTILRPILLYGHESWILTKKLKSKMTAAEMRVLRLVKGVTRRDRLCEETQSLRHYRQTN